LGLKRIGVKHALCCPDYLTDRTRDGSMFGDRTCIVPSFYDLKAFRKH